MVVFENGCFISCANRELKRGIFPGGRRQEAHKCPMGRRLCERQRDGRHIVIPKVEGSGLVAQRARRERNRESAPVRVLLIRVLHELTIVRAVFHAVVVIVFVADIPGAVVVVVELVVVRVCRAIVHVTADTVFVRVIVEVQRARVTDVTQTILIKIKLVKPNLVQAAAKNPV